MRTLLSVLLALGVILVVVVAATVVVSEGNNNNNGAPLQPADPIMGILTMPNIHDWKSECSEYTQMTYVNWLGTAGVRAYPVFYKMPHAEMRKVLDSVNGVLFTGGMLSLKDETTYFQAAQFIYNYTLERNAAGSKFVLKGTCQGFQLLALLVATVDGRTPWDVLKCDCVGTMGVSMPLDLTNGTDGWWFQWLPNAPASIVDDLTKKNTTANLHNCRVVPGEWDVLPAVKDNYRVLSTNKDMVGKSFVSTFEHKKNIGIFATQWHPEAAQWWYDEAGLNKEMATLRVSMYAANELSHRLRLNNHSFGPAVDAATGRAMPWTELLITQYPRVQNSALQYTAGFYCTEYGKKPSECGPQQSPSKTKSGDDNDAGTAKKERDVFVGLFAVTLIALIGTVVYTRMQAAKQHGGGGGDDPHYHQVS